MGLLPPHLPQKGDVRGHGIMHPWIFYVDEPIFLTGLPDDPADRRIMNMGYFREEMMLDLEIQPAHQPAHDRVMGREICGRFELMDRPFVFHLSRLHIRYGECRMLHCMRQLKYHAQHKTGYHGKDDEADHPVVPAQPVDRQHDKDKRMECLEPPEYQVIRKAHL